MIDIIIHTWRYDRKGNLRSSLYLQGDQKN